MSDVVRTRNKYVSKKVKIQNITTWAEKNVKIKKQQVRKCKWKYI